MQAPTGYAEDHCGRNAREDRPARHVLDTRRFLQMHAVDEAILPHPLEVVLLSSQDCATLQSRQ
eukprot:6325633-Amphidinium_carterae.1